MTAKALIKEIAGNAVYVFVSYCVAYYFFREAADPITSLALWLGMAWTHFIYYSKHRGVIAA